jgi:glutathionyl-hydroquinone reductase
MSGCTRISTVRPRSSDPDFRSEANKLGVDGVYRSGFATTQEAYETAGKTLFAALDRVEERLKGKEYLVGDRLTEADVRLWVTVVSASHC